MRLRFTSALTGITLVLFTAVGVVLPAAAAPADKAAVLLSWTQTSAGSFTAWYDARQHQADWAAYVFDWSTDYCSDSPDNPLGFPFELSCARHDFGYRNYKAAGQFPANKDRLDSSFYSDLKRVCAAYTSATRTACNDVAWTYYEAVHLFGSVSPENVARARERAAAGIG